ncbi:hypothetical protein K402DRAFT_422427 [Aulographum hederae CBS 113979]|uniref:Uncharacterized protein n=1 Tax=Aulographum hederae CBS 113979 TaxID=1176131 RepID=A0A6G1GW33_9PEZI|nr:hypothetical protein K402DRAFT_422427 [Aulographum hederae CBS 113979]
MFAQQSSYKSVDNRDNDYDDPDDAPYHDGTDEYPFEEQMDEGEDGGESLLPIFSAEILDKLPVYNMTHAVRLLVIQRCETTLSWDQLRSPQISQFLVKPLQQEILASHFNRATLYTLMANNLQFQKEGHMNPGSVGVSKTRAMMCELLAMRLLRDTSTRELIDALSYDFDPLQGFVDPRSGTATPAAHLIKHNARISTIEIAIRAQAKKFLAHPLVVQQLEAIWAGSVVFHSAADNMHRRLSRQPGYSRRRRAYGTLDSQSPVRQSRRENMIEPNSRRSATLYDPSDSSLFKLSRLRVPRYRQIFSTISFAVMLGLFLAVLIQRSLDITALEVVFWFWSAGYMLDEVVGFSEQGFGLYIMSVWNAFDIGILMLLIAYYVMRLYGILMPDVRKRYIANMAYDTLASTAVLLFPRLFSVLDHYRYFSQLLIAFRMMAMDLVAILILIVICCSGFFVAFTLSFAGVDFTAGGAAYALFQMLMGFTPAAWEIWDTYNLLGKAILTLFLFICHFLIVTILITVLTNSFMAVVQNANDEHQFLFAVNTISLVKSDALFSYIPPTNVLGWLLSPARYFVSFRHFVKINRTVIKITHIPILFSIFAYERVILSHLIHEPVELIERRGRTHAKMPAFALHGNSDHYSPQPRMREPSVTTFNKDRALAEVFRRPFKDSAGRIHRESTAEEGNTGGVVHEWMTGMGQEGGASPPVEQPRSIVDRLENKRPRIGRSKTTHLMPHDRRVSNGAKSAVSDPEDVRYLRSPSFHPIQEEESELDQSMEDLAAPTDEGAEDDSYLTTDEIEDEDVGTEDQMSVSQLQDEDESGHRSGLTESEVEFLGEPIERGHPRPSTAVKAETNLSSSYESAIHDHRQNAGSKPSSLKRRPMSKHHTRHPSTATILYNPMIAAAEPSRRKTPPSLSSSPRQRPQTAKNSGGGGSGGPTSGTRTPARGQRTPKLAPAAPVAGPTARPRPILPPRGLQSAPNLAGFLALDQQHQRRGPSLNARALDLASDLGDNRFGPDIGAISGMPASFSTQFEMAARMRQFEDDQRRWRQGGGGSSRPRQHQHQQHPPPQRRAGKWDDVEEEDEEESESSDEDARRMSKLVLARMNMLEDGFKEVLREVRGLKGVTGGGGGSSVGAGEEGSAADSGKTVARAKSGKKRRPTRLGMSRRVSSEKGKSPERRRDFTSDTARSSV